MNDNYKHFSDYLACPHTKNNLKLTESSDSHFFESDSGKYLIKDDVPVFLSKLNYNNPDDEKFMESIQDFWNSGWEKRTEEDDHSFLYELNEEELFKRIKASYDSQRSRGEGIGTYLSNELKIDALKGKTCIIVGPGCGEEAMELHLLSKAKVIGIDLSHKSATLTNKFLHKFGDKSGIGIQGDSRFLPIQSNSIDYVFSSGVIHHSPNIQKSIDEIHRVLKPNGEFCVALYHKYSITWMKFLLKALLRGNWTKKKLNKYISRQTENAWITDDKKNPHTKLFSRPQCFNLFKDFSDVNVRAGNFYTPGNFILKFFSIVKNTKVMSKLGSMVYISGSKK